MADPVSIKSLTIPASMLATILGGAGWLTTTRADLNHLTDKVENHRQDFKENTANTSGKFEIINNIGRGQDERLSRMEGKQDLILHTIQQIEQRILKK